MLNRPRFMVTERWDESGTVDVYFQDALTLDLYKVINNELNCRLPKLNKDERTLYHLESVVNGIFSNMITKGNLRRGRNNKEWGYAVKVK